MKRSMKLQIFGAVLAGGFAVAAQAQFNTLKFDINNIQTEITLSGVSYGLAAGGDDAFGGLSPFNGTITWSMGTETVFFGEVQGHNGGSPFGGTFVDAGSPSMLTDVSGVLEFTGGLTTGIDFTFTNDVGDTFTTSVAADGRLQWAPNVYTVTGLTFSGVFEHLAPGFGDKLFGLADTSLFFAGSVAIPAAGLFTEFFLAEGQASQQTDLDMIVSIPLPGGAAMASLCLLGLVSRRRSRVIREPRHR